MEISVPQQPAPTCRSLLPQRVLEQHRAELTERYNKSIRPMVKLAWYILNESSYENACLAGGAVAWLTNRTTTFNDVDIFVQFDELSNVKKSLYGISSNVEIAKLIDDNAEELGYLAHVDRKKIHVNYQDYSLNFPEATFVMDISLPLPEDKQADCRPQTLQLIYYNKIAKFPELPPLDPALPQLFHKCRLIFDNTLCEMFVLLTDLLSFQTADGLWNLPVYTTLCRCDEQNVLFRKNGHRIYVPKDTSEINNTLVNTIDENNVIVQCLLTGKTFRLQIFDHLPRYKLYRTYARMTKYVKRLTTTDDFLEPRPICQQINKST